jgi:hypothetical protein
MFTLVFSVWHVEYPAVTLYGAAGLVVRIHACRRYHDGQVPCGADGHYELGILTTDPAYAGLQFL